MADTKTTKKATEVKTIETLQAELATKQADMLEAKRGHAAGELANPRVITATRKEIARLHTAIRAAELDAAEESK
ncbi:MAG TPA: 50S ribosomal protein L29 [Candidatus Saccharimonadales bacterium]|nr:50S ribosomal protein L29 [Candidatus Saccharimonadales bacterium]